MSNMFKIYKYKKETGLTLIELIIVLTLIFILAAVSIPLYTNSVKAAEEAVLKENLYILRELISQFYMDKHRYPEDLLELVEEGYIREIPFDPITGRQDTWITEQPYDYEESGIYDVKSGAEGQALDGSYYTDW